MNKRLINISVSKFLLGILGVATIFITGCKSDPNSPGFEFMPDMYRSPSYETYLENHAFGGADSMSARVPVKGTVPRGFTPALVDGSAEGYSKSDQLVNPIAFNENVLAEGKDKYIKMCSHCHGKTGEADGKVVTNGGFPPPPNFKTGNSSRGGKLSELSAGKIYHTITYGVNMMGSHASQISSDDRWKIVYFVQELQGKKQNEVKEEVTVEQAVDSTEVTENTEG